MHFSCVIDTIIKKKCVSLHSMNGSPNLIRAIFMLIALTLLPLAARAEKFVFTTSWTAQAQFAGYYVAKEKGFYKAEGLDVEIEPASLMSDPLNRLRTNVTNATMFSLMSAIDIISQGHALVNIFQDSMNSSNLLISRWDTDPMKMKGKKVAIFNSDPNYLTYIISKKEGLDYDFVRFTSNIKLFLSGAVDATMAVSYNEYQLLRQAGFKMSKESVCRFSDHGYNIQEHGVYVERDFFLTHREQCRKFAAASRKGWEWAAKHPDEALEIAMKYVRRYNAATNRVMQKLMLEEVLRLQIDRDSKKREFKVRRDMVKKASSLMFEFGMIKRPVTYEELMGL